MAMYYHSLLIQPHLRLHIHFKPLPKQMNCSSQNGYVHCQDCILQTFYFLAFHCANEHSYSAQCPVWKLHLTARSPKQSAFPPSKSGDPHTRMIPTTALPTVSLLLHCLSSSPDDMLLEGRMGLTQHLIWLLGPQK